MSEPNVRILWRLFLFAISSTLVVTAWVYLRGWLALRSAFPNLVAVWRLAAFMSGLVLVWIAVGSPLATLDHQLLTIHMLKHLLLMTVAAPLILAGAPVFILVCGLPKLFIKRYPPIGSLPARWLERCVRYPALCWLAGTAAVIWMAHSRRVSVGHAFLRDAHFGGPIVSGGRPFVLVACRAISPVCSEVG